MDDLKISATYINKLLSRYIDLHNTFIKSTGSIWSIFKKINYRQLSGEAYILFQQLSEERNKLEKLKVHLEDTKEIEFANSLYNYTKALTETVYLLFILLHALSEKAKGESLSMSEHMENNKKYLQSIDQYMKLGEDLNKIYSSF